MPGPGGVLPYLNIDQEQCEPGYNGKQWLAMVSSAGCDIVQTLIHRYSHSPDTCLPVSSAPGTGRAVRCYHGLLKLSKGPET